jgi:hypothetical protein
MSQKIARVEETKTSSKAKRRVGTNSTKVKGPADSKVSPEASQEQTEPDVIRLTRIKQWYIVADTESYLILKKLGAPMIRIHQTFLPTLQLLTKDKPIRIVGVNFNDAILEPFIDKATGTWTKKYGKCTVTSKVMVFQAAGDKVKAAKEALPKLETVLQNFFNRWGYRFQLSYSEGKESSRIKLHVEYWFDAEKMPLIPLETPVEEIPKVQWDLGFTRLTFSFDDTVKLAKQRKIGYVHLLIEISQGGKFVPYYSSKCLYNQISSVKPMILALMNVLNHDIHNLDNKSE